MSRTAVIRFIAAILASWLVMWLAHGRLPEPLVQGLAFWVMFLIIPMTFARDGAKEPKATSPKRIAAAAAGAVLVVILSTLFMGWK